MRRVRRREIGSDRMGLGGEGGMKCCVVSEKGGKRMSLTSNFCRGPKIPFLPQKKFKLETVLQRQKFVEKTSFFLIEMWEDPKVCFPWPTFLLQIPRLSAQRRRRRRGRRRRGPLLTSPYSAPPSETPEAFQGPGVHLLKLHFFGKRRVGWWPRFLKGLFPDFSH